MVLLRYIEDKDVFQKFYSRFLAKRLIHTNPNLDKELDMIQHLKTLFGNEFTMKLQRMYTDYQTNDVLNDAFQGVFKVLILTAGSWPLCASPCQLLLPFNLNKQWTEFCSFYDSMYNGRRLSIMHNLCRGYK